MEIIRNISQLSASEPTVIKAETAVLIPGCYIDFDGNTLNPCAKGARYTLRADSNDARVRDLVIG